MSVVAWNTTYMIHEPMVFSQNLLNLFYPIIPTDNSVSVSAKSADHGKPPAKESHKDLFSVLCFTIFLLMIYFILSKTVLQGSRKIHLVACYRLHEMKANPDKFHAIFSNCESEGGHCHCLYVNCCSIEPSEEVTLLGVRLDNRLVFSHHTNELCKKTG